MATNYTVHLNGEEPTATVLNLRLEEINTAIENIKDGTDALASPEIESFVNGQHSHANAAGGGPIEASSIKSTGATVGQEFAADGNDGVLASDAITLPATFRQGLRIRKLSDNEVIIGTGSVVVNGQMVDKHTQTVLDINNGEHWIGGVSNVVAMFIHHLYVNVSSEIRWYDLCPSQSVPDSYVCEMRVNQSGWDGTSANGGYDEVSIVVDDGGAGNPVGMGNIQAGMLMGVYVDSSQTSGRYKYEGALSTRQALSFARITAVDTETNTLTLAAGHKIGISDNDYLTVIHDAPPVYRYADGQWWRWLGSIDRGLNSLTDKYNHRSNYVQDDGINRTTTSTTMTAMPLDSLTLITMGGDVVVHFHCNMKNSGSGGWTAVGISLDYDYDTTPELVRQVNPDQASANRATHLEFTHVFRDLLPGRYDISLTWKSNGSNTSTLILSTPVYPQFWGKEVSPGGI